MMTRATKLLVILTALCAVGAARAQDQYSEIRTDIEREIAAGRATGVAVALTQEGKIIWEEGFGWADKERGRRVTAHTAFSLASVTKPFTTTTLMTLVAAGKLSLDARANDYLGRAKIRAGVGNPDSVTVRALASHSSGLPGTFQIFPAGGPLQQPTMDEVIRTYGVLVTPPGERFGYSNVGMGIVAHIASRNSGLEFGTLIRQQVLDPLGLADSFFDTELARRGEMAQRYDRDGKAFPFYVTSTPGTGELYASAHDVARFAMFHLRDHLPDQKKILNDAQIDELHRPVIHVREDRSHGVGWMLGRAFDGTPVVYHTGNQAGVVTVMMLLPSRDIACVVLSNHDDAHDLVDRIRDATIRTLVPTWQWHSLAPSPAQPLPPTYRGAWRGKVQDGATELAVVLTIADKESTLQIDGGKPEPISQLGLVDGALVGTARGKLAFPTASAAQAEGLSLRLQLRGAKLAGEIGARIPIPRAAVPGYLPFFAELSLSSAPSAASRPAPRASASPAPR
jgi:CubicO group peptidase (beta-lactamase class C family)